MHPGLPFFRTAALLLFGSDGLPLVRANQDSVGCSGDITLHRRTIIVLEPNGTTGRGGGR
jgi:hypothetical protein